MHAQAAAPSTPTRDGFDALQARFGERFSTALSVRQAHGHGAGHHRGAPPEAVVFATCVEEVQFVARWASQTRCPLVPFGAGTSVEGHVSAVHGGVTLDLSRMNQVLRVSVEDADCTVQAGVTREQLGRELRHTGLFFPVDPGADATLGGMCSTRASGTNAVRYGTMRENVLALSVVLADGRLIRTARRARKSAAGYDLTRLFVGAEGTLGIIAEATLRLHPVPQALAAAVCAFDTIEGAVASVIDGLQCGLRFSRVELMDALQMDAMNRYARTDYAVAPTLLLEFGGSSAEVAEQVEAMAAIASSNAGHGFRWASTPEERASLWQARHRAALALRALRPGPDVELMSTDVCVPISSLADCVVQTQADLRQSGLVGGIAGHVGDGNFHVGLLLDRADAIEGRAASAFHDRLVERALAMEGTCTGEHGIGTGKMRYMRAEHGEAVDAMLAIKQALDPLGILNPGKVLP
jgi:D-lactate dehydrogenase (cytochrome)